MAASLFPHKFRQTKHSLTAQHAPAKLALLLLGNIALAKQVFRFLVRKHRAPITKIVSGMTKSVGQVMQVPKEPWFID